MSRMFICTDRRGQKGRAKDRCMNARMSEIWVLGLLLTLPVRGAEANDSPAEPAPPVPAATVITTNAVSPAPTPSKEITEAPPAPVTNAEPVKVVRAPSMTLPPLLDQVVRMSERGTDEAVVKAYIESAPAYKITGN